MVLPVYNTMPYLTRCLDSLVEQSLGLGRIQVIAVDDGSTDDSPEVLDSYAVRHPGSFQVVHQANSGGPAEPCNRGLELAGGRYVFFLGADDYLGREALERLVRAATHWDSDVIFGRMVGVGGRYVDQRMFGASRREVDFLNSPLAFAVSNTKLFRRSLIEQHRIRYALDLRVSSDQPFTVAALLKSRRISVLSGYPFYYAVRRVDDSNITYSSHWTTRLTDITAIMEHLAGLVGPGSVRDALFHRHFQWEMDKLLRNELPKLDEHEQRALIQGVSAVADRYLTPGVSRRLAPKFRLPISLARAGRLDDTARRSRLPTHDGAAVVGAVGGGRVFEWAPGFAEADATVDWYEVLTDDLDERLVDRARSRCSSCEDRGLEITGRVGLRAASATHLRVRRLPSSGGLGGCPPSVVSREARRPNRLGSSRSTCSRHRTTAGATWSAASIFARCCPLPAVAAVGRADPDRCRGQHVRLPDPRWRAITRRRSCAAATRHPVELRAQQAGRSCSHRCAEQEART